MPFSSSGTARPSTTPRPLAATAFRRRSGYRIYLRDLSTLGANAIPEAPVRVGRDREVAPHGRHVGEQHRSARLGAARQRGRGAVPDDYLDRPRAPWTSTSTATRTPPTEISGRSRSCDQHRRQHGVGRLPDVRAPATSLLRRRAFAGHLPRAGGQPVGGTPQRDGRELSATTWVVNDIPRLTFVTPAKKAAPTISRRRSSATRGT